MIKGGLEANILVNQIEKKSRAKTDWEELAEECQAFVKEKGLTEKDLHEIEIFVEKLLDGGSCG
ncbi:MAG: hypothetical protein GX036_04920 [Firmicutes bacterium]|nr:hypothetical protein [Bacillota bacterium]